MAKKILKITPIKRPTLCEKCKYDLMHKCMFMRCKDCKQKRRENDCACFEIEYGEPCIYFERFVG